jgi:hypothetical protein
LEIGWTSIKNFSVCKKADYLSTLKPAAAAAANKKKNAKVLD